MSEGTTATSSTSTRRSERIATAPAVKAAGSKRKVSARQQWLEKNADLISELFEICAVRLAEANEGGVKAEGKYSCTNFAEILVDEFALGVARVVNEDSTDDEDDVDGLCSEDEEEETEESSSEDEDDVDLDDDDEEDETDDVEEGETKE